MTRARWLAIATPALAASLLGCGAEPAKRPAERPEHAATSSTPGDSAPSLRVLSAQPLIRSGICDASAGVALDSGYIVVANDENNVLSVYRADTGGAPVRRVQLSAALGLANATEEADIEGATTIGDTTYWIASHSSAKNGSQLPERRRLFATVVERRGGVPTVRAAGRVETGLLDALLRDSALARFDIAEAAKRPPEAVGGLNIEGLAATEDRRLLVGFRNPIPAGRALVVPIENPAQVVFGRERPRLGSVMTIDLGGRGIRSMEYVSALRAFVIAAGTSDDRRDFALYRWAGSVTDTPRRMRGVRFDAITPEAIVVDRRQPGRLQILSDDGGMLVGKEECKTARDSRKYFRSLVVEASAR